MKKVGKKMQVSAPKGKSKAAVVKKKDAKVSKAAASNNNNKSAPKKAATNNNQKKKSVAKPVVDPVQENSDRIRAEIEIRNNLGGDSVTRLMCGMLSGEGGRLFSAKVEDRSAIQNEMVSMIEKVLLQIQTDLKAATTEQEDLLANGDNVAEQNNLNGYTTYTQRRNTIFNFIHHQYHIIQHWAKDQ
jgi:hypothetical protein